MKTRIGNHHLDASTCDFQERHAPMRAHTVSIVAGIVVAAGLLLAPARPAGAAAQSSNEAISTEAESNATAWQFGVAKVKITPTEPVWMAGYSSRDRPADGTLIDLWAKALVLEDAEGHRIVLITLDLVGIERHWSQSMTDRLNKELGYERAEIAINASHTHTGPVVGQNLRPMHYLLVSPEHQDRITRYSEWLQDRVCEAVTSASNNLETGSLRWGNGRATFAVNRRNNRPESEVPQRRTRGELVGPIDHDVPVLSVRDADGTIRAVVFGYACHATVLSSFQWSGDYPGFAQLALEREIPDCVAMFWAGCGADQNPLPRRTVALAQHYGERLAGAVQSVLMTSEMLPIAPSIQSTYKTIDLPFDELPNEEALIRDSESTNRFVAARATALLEQVQSGTPLPTTYPYPIQQWILGDQIDWLFLGGEVVVEYAARLKTERRGTRTWVAGYSNDVMAYIPSRTVWLEGGYEGADAMIYYGLPTRWAENVETVLVDGVPAIDRDSN